jgi:hypothetical protein
MADPADSRPVGSVTATDVSHSLHLLVSGIDIHLRMPATSQPDEILAECAEAMRNQRVVEFPNTLPPRATERSTVVINFEYVSGAWIDNEA